VEFPARYYMVAAVNLSIFKAMKSLLTKLFGGPGPLAILVVALVVRVAYLVAYQTLPEWHQLTVDNWYHHNWAVSLIDGSLLGGTTYFRAPFYIYCLAAMYGLFGVSLWVARLFGLIVGMLSVLMTIRIGSAVFDRRAGLLAGLIHALYPICLYFEFELLLDPLFALLLQVAVYLALKWSETGRERDIRLAGLFLGLSIITRPTALIYLPLGMIMILIMRRGQHSVGRTLIGFVAAALIVIAPITARNIMVAGDPVLISSQGGINLYIGNNDTADGVSAVMPEPLGFNWRIQQVAQIAEADLGRTLKPGEVSSWWMSRALSWIGDHPGRFAELYVTKLYHAVSDAEISNNRNLDLFFSRMDLLRYNPLSFGLILGLAVLGLILSGTTNRRARILALVLLAYILAASLFFFNSRFRLPLLPYFFVLASGGVMLFIKMVNESMRRAWPAATAGLIAAALSYYPLLVLPSGGLAQAKLSEGLYHFSQQDYDRALTAFRTARMDDPAFPEINLNLGVTFLRQGVSDSALFYLNQEQALHPGRVKGSINKASWYLVNEQHEKALSEIQPALEVRPYDVIANRVYLRALSADSATTGDALYAAIDEAARRTDDNVYLLNDAANLLIERRAESQAEKLLLRAANSQPPAIETDDEAFEQNFVNSRSNWDMERAKSYYQLGFLYGLSGYFGRAIDYSRRAIETDSSLAEAYVNLVSGYLSSGQIELGRETYRLAKEKFPANEVLDQLSRLLNDQ